MRLRRLRLALGLASAAVMIAWGILHATVGWAALESRMSRTNVEPEVLEGLRVPWHLATLAMVGFGAVALLHYIAIARRHAHDPSAVRLAGSAYSLFGLWAIIAVHADPFFLSYVVPGALVALCADGERGRARTALDARDGSASRIHVSREPDPARS